MLCDEGKTGHPEIDGTITLESCHMFPEGWQSWWIWHKELVRFHANFISADRYSESSQRIHPGKRPFQKVPDQISSIWGSTALMAADQSNRSRNFCAVLRVHARPGPVLRNNHLEDVASGVKPTAQCKQDVQETKNYAQKEHCWALPEILCICEWTSIFWHRQPSPCEIKQPREMGTTLLIQHVCIFRDTICTKKVISSAFHRARETVLILSDPFQKKRRVPRIQDYI